MQQSPTVTHDPPEPRLPGRTTPTWETELLVSAGSVFTLVQVPGWVDQAYVALRPRLDLAWDLLFRLLYTYGKIGLLLLAAAFALHLTMRAYWIALVGMDSIYPEGLRWDRRKEGPRRRHYAQSRYGTMAERIERADNRSSIVFALGISMALTMAVLVVAVVAAYLVAWMLSAAFGWTWLFPEGFILVLVFAAVPYALAFYADRAWGNRLAPGGRAARIIDAVYAAYGRIGYGRGTNITLELLQSHVGERRMSMIVVLAIVICGLVAGFQLSLQSGAPAVGDYARWPAADAGLDDSLVAAHYRDQGAADDVFLPTIDSAFPRGDYLTVVVPFNPRRHPAQLERTCLQAWRSADSPARREALLDCFGRWLALRLDGQPLPASRPRYFTDPRTGQQAIAVVVPIRGLPAGEHEVRLALAPSESKQATPQPPEYRIAFWR